MNTTLSVTCPYTPGNPAETRFTWFYANTSAIGSNQNLSLSNVQLTGEGYYKCRVNNTMDPTGCTAEEGYDETTFFVDVQYPAKIRRFSADGSVFASSVTINESQTVTLLCEADSDPLATLEIVNFTKSDERLLGEAHNNTISARVVNARCEFDMGVYQCKGKNIHNAVQQVREIEIKIACSPRPSPFTTPIVTAYRRRNSSAILSFTIVAYPPPNDASAYVWRKQVDGKWVTLLNNNRFQIRLSNDSLQTNLSISQLQIDDFTNYSVRVNNQVGSTEQTFVIRATEQPSVPQQLLVVDAMVTESSVTVKWTPGFNGGEDQWFVIGYKKAADEFWTYINVSSTVTQLSIGDLVAGTKYEVKMYAENIIGKSDETTALSVTTQSVISDNGSSPSVGAAVGGAVGGILAVVIFVVLWKYRNAFKRKPGEGAQYDDLFNRQADVLAANTSSEYEAYRVGMIMDIQMRIINLSKQTSTRHSRKLRFMNIRYYHLAANRIIVLRTV
ncbi:protein turtle-like isoform X2 [Dreissena polymorpha]|uniref:protein turtle-like isoform X2 n=1 Tax=Dreissena polymorpha TaxID=45954 RepID=UPI002264D9BB|nr:protein turtle-like isoform X2 [Dreissena polymorpha]